MNNHRKQKTVFYIHKLWSFCNYSLILSWIRYQHNVNVKKQRESKYSHKAQTFQMRWYQSLHSAPTWTLPPLQFFLSEQKLLQIDKFNRSKKVSLRNMRNLNTQLHVTQAVIGYTTKSMWLSEGVWTNKGTKPWLWKIFFKLTASPSHHINKFDKGVSSIGQLQVVPHPAVSPFLPFHPLVAQLSPFSS